MTSTFRKIKTLLEKSVIEELGECQPRYPEHKKTDHRPVFDWPISNGNKMAEH